VFVKSPAAILDYEFDWSTWIPTGDTISAVTFTGSSGITVETSPAVSHTNSTATAWVGGGTAGQTYTLSCQITTTAGRVDVRTQSINVVNL
jgi:hypothetical protein